MSPQNDIKMENLKSKLMSEYIKKYQYILHWQQKISGFNRFDIENGKIVQLGVDSLVYKMVILTTANCGVLYLLYTSIFHENYLKVPDGICIIHFSLFANLIIFNMSFKHRSSGVDLIDSCIKIDLFLGCKDVLFLRNILHRTFIVINIGIMFINLTISVFLFNAYKVSTTIHVIGSTYFFWLIFVYNDYVLLVCFTLFLTLRVQYLNISLLKSGNMKEKYLPQGSLFNLLFWNKKFNKLVKFQKRSITDYVTAYRMFYDMLRLIEKSYKFSLSLGVLTVVTGTFVGVQTFIMRIKDSVAVENERTIIIVGWAIMSWAFITSIVILSDMFVEQLDQTKFICCYIQLKANQPEHIYKLTKTVIQIISENQAGSLVYNTFFLNKKLIFNLAASTLIYITVQLQMAFPDLSIDKDKGQSDFANNTATLTKAMTYRLL